MGVGARIRGEMVNNKQTSKHEKEKLCADKNDKVF